MKVPKTNVKKPFIKFEINKKSKIKLSATSEWWGGKNGGFYDTNGISGNTCLPKDLECYIKCYKEKQIKLIEKEIKVLQTEVEIIKSITF